MYDKLYDLDAEHVNRLEDFCIALSDATQAAKDGHYADLDASHILYLFEFYKIVKIGQTAHTHALSGQGFKSHRPF